MSNPNDIRDHFVMLQNRILARLTVSDKAVDRVVLDWPVPTSANTKGIPFMTERVGDFANKLAQNLGTLGGIVGVVLTPTATMNEEEDGTLDMTAPVIVQIQENVLINQGANGTKVSALTLATFVMRRLQGFCHGLYGGELQMSRMLLDRKPFVLLKATGPVVYNVAVNAPLDLAARLPDEFDELLFDDGSVVQYA
jgi:hypothetical protein